MLGFAFGSRWDKEIRDNKGTAPHLRKYLCRIWGKELEVRRLDTPKILSNW